MDGPLYYIEFCLNYAGFLRGEIPRNATLFHSNLQYQTTLPFTIKIPKNQNPLPTSLESPNLSIHYFLNLYAWTEQNSYAKLASRKIQLVGRTFINFPTEIESVSVTTSNLPLTLTPPTPGKYYLLREPILFATFEDKRNMRDKIAIIVKILKTRSSIWTEMEDKLVMGAESRESARQSVTWGKLVDKNFAVKFNPFYVQTGLVLPGLRIQHFINVSNSIFYLFILKFSESENFACEIQMHFLVKSVY